ncbi:hypothetical protein OAL71_02025 [Phycisphaerales bacterium]|nr:hypothetical protein [Phycisphaerales bacterium]
MRRKRGIAADAPPTDDEIAAIIGAEVVGRKSWTPTNLLRDLNR